MFQVVNGVISMNKSRVLTPKQLNTLQRIENEYDRNRYLMSLMGLIKSHVSIPRLKLRNEDALYTKPKGSVLRQMKQLQRVNTDHAPNNKGLGQWVGVEIECIIPHQDGNGGGECCCEYDADGETEYYCDSCSGENGNNWSCESAHNWLKEQLREAGVTRCCVKFDGSLEDDDGHGVEITILFNSAYGYESLQRLCKALSKAGCYVNKTCGLHVHLDARHLKAKQVEKIGHSIGCALPILKWMVPESRHDNNYCKIGVSQLRGDRYFAVNLTAFRKYKTIEIRLHSGSINASKIESWVTLLKTLGAAKLKVPLSTFQDLMNVKGMNEPLIEYADRRITELNPDAWPKLMNEQVAVKTVKEHFNDLMQEGA